MHFILMHNIKVHINSHKPYGCSKTWLGKNCYMLVAVWNNDSITHFVHIPTQLR